MTQSHIEVVTIKAGGTRPLNEALGDPASGPGRALGVGHLEALRGGLAHWIVIEDGKIANYQAVVPRTWNGGPRDPAVAATSTSMCRTHGPNWLRRFLS